MKLRYSGKYALITGGSCEIALCLAELLIHAGVRPILACRGSRGEEKISSAMEKWHGKYETCLLDFSNPASLEALFENPDFEPDYLVDLAQGDMETLVGAADALKTRRYFDENIGFRAGLLKHMVRGMLKKRFGRLLFVSSAAAASPNRGQGFYAASKLAAEALYKNIGLEMGKRGITTVSLRPGYVEAGRGTEFVKKRGSEILKKIPTGKALSKNEVAESIMFFLSDSALGFNATEILMDGGMNSGKQQGE